MCSGVISFFSAETQVLEFEDFVLGLLVMVVVVVLAIELVFVLVLMSLALVLVLTKARTRAMAKKIKVAANTATIRIRILKLFIKYSVVAAPPEVTRVTTIAITIVPAEVMALEGWATRRPVGAILLVAVFAEIILPECELAMGEDCKHVW